MILYQQVILTPNHPMPQSNPNSQQVILCHKIFLIPNKWSYARTYPNNQQVILCQKVILACRQQVILVQNNNLFFYNHPRAPQMQPRIGFGSPMKDPVAVFAFGGTYGLTLVVSKWKSVGNVATNATI